MNKKPIISNEEKKRRNKIINNRFDYEPVKLDDYQLSENQRQIIFDKLKQELSANVINEDTIQFNILTPQSESYLITYTLTVNGLHSGYTGDTLDYISLKLSPGNSKIRQQAKDYKKKVEVFDLLSGRTCPAALHCFRRVVLPDNDLTKRTAIKGDSNLYDCFATKAEGQYTFTYLLRLVNTLVIELLTKDEIKSILNTLINKTDIIRFHGSGDFFLKKYYNAVKELASENPSKIFYAYSKMLPYVLDDKSDNFGIIYSEGGKFDKKALDSNAPHAIVDVSNLKNSPQFEGIQYACESLEDDFIRILNGESFLLHLH